MTIETTEMAYTVLARDVLRFVDGRPWDVAFAHYGILHSSVSSQWWLEAGGECVRTGGARGSLEQALERGDAVRFLRADLMKSAETRIWGLTFTLYPTGKFNIEYDYKKPEGYEESDEVITGDEINASLSNLDQGSDD